MYICIYVCIKEGLGWCARAKDIVRRDDASIVDAILELYSANTAKAPKRLDEQIDVQRTSLFVDIKPRAHSSATMAFSCGTGSG